MGGPSLRQWLFTGGGRGITCLQHTQIAKSYLWCLKPRFTRYPAFLSGNPKRGRGRWFHCTGLIFIGFTKQTSKHPEGSHVSNAQLLGKTFFSNLWIPELATRKVQEILGDNCFTESQPRACNSPGWVKQAGETAVCKGCSQQPKRKRGSVPRKCPMRPG